MRPSIQLPSPLRRAPGLFLLACLVALVFAPAAPVTAADTLPTLAFSTYLGGNGYDFGEDIAVDTAGNIYVVGFTESTNFPASNPFGVASTPNGYKTYVTKFDPTGTTQLYSLFLGAGFARGIAVDGDGAAYVVGGGSDIPMVNAIQPTYAGMDDAFIAKINPSGTALVYSTYLGGTNFDTALGVALDPLNNAYVVGYTNSTDFPTENPYQATFGGNQWHTFVVKINSAGSALVYSTYYGGNGFDGGYDIAADDSGNAYITGYTESNNFPAINAYQSEHANPCLQPPSGSLCADGFVAKFSASGVPVYSTYLGGDGDHDSGKGIAVDSTGSAYITGETNSINFPIRNAYQATRPALTSAFVTKLSPDGLHLIYSTYLGGTNGGNGGEGIAINSVGNAYVVGVTNTTDFPTVSPIQAVRGGVSNNTDIFTTTFSADGQSILFSSYLGGSDNDGLDEISPRITIGLQNKIYITDTTYSNDFPLKNAFQNIPGGSPNPNQSYDAFVVKIAFPPLSLPGAGTERNYFTTHPPTLTWSPVTWAIGYRVQVETTATFAAPYAFEGDAPANEAFITTDPLPNGLYYWRVQAQKPDGSWGVFSSPDSFTIAVDD